MNTPYDYFLPKPALVLYCQQVTRSSLLTMNIYVNKTRQGVLGSNRNIPLTYTNLHACAQWRATVDLLT